MAIINSIIISVDTVLYRYTLTVERLFYIKFSFKHNLCFKILINVFNGKCLLLLETNIWICEVTFLSNSRVLTHYNKTYHNSSFSECFLRHLTILI